MSAILCISAAFPAQAADFTSPAEMGTTMYSTVRLNLRKGPGTDSDILSTLSPGDPVTVSEDFSDGWVSVDADGVSGYVYAQYLSGSEPETYPAISAESGVSMEMLNSVEASYGLIPENVRDHFEGSGWKAVIVSGNLGARHGYSSILGITDTSTNTISIDNREKAIYSIIHEMGHYIDIKEGWISKGDEFSGIRQAEVGTFVSFWDTDPANVASCTEYFAEAFEASCREPDVMEKNCPLSYEFVMDCADML